MSEVSKNKLDQNQAKEFINSFEKQMITVAQIPGGKKMIPYVNKMTVSDAFKNAGINNTKGFTMQLNSKVIDHSHLNQIINPNDQIIIAKIIGGAN